MFDYQTQIS